MERKFRPSLSSTIYNRRRFENALLSMRPLNFTTFTLFFVSRYVLNTKRTSQEVTAACIIELVSKRVAYECSEQTFRKYVIFIENRQ